MCRKLRQKLFIVSHWAKNRILRGCDGRPQDNTSNLSRPRAWVEINSSALSTTLVWPCPEQRGATMGCLYLEIEGQSCLVGSVDQGLMKNRQNHLLDRMTKKGKKNKTIFWSFFPHGDATRNRSANNPKKKLEILRPYYRPLSSV